jgi:hypothetical protein
VTVHRGGGRAGSTNSYTVVMAIGSPGQNVTPDELSGGDSGDSPPLTQLRPGTPDPALSPDPPGNHQGTAAAPGRQARAGGPHAAGGTAEAAEFFGRLAAMSPRWQLAAAQRGRLGPAVTAALARGWLPAGLAEHVGANTAGIRNASAVLAARLSPAELPLPAGTMAARRPAWCGHCDEQTRMGEHADGADAGRCPACHPLGESPPHWRAPRQARTS